MRPGMNIGAKMSIREEASPERLLTFRELLIDDTEDKTKTYFQLADVDQHSKVIERRLITATENFLTKNGVSTKEFTSRVTAILNYGVMHMGTGDINDSRGATTSQPSGDTR
jgi:hypothetical protein